MGQRGLTEFDDPRFSVAFVSSKDASVEKPAYVDSCSFYKGYSTHIGVFDATAVLVHNNIIMESYESCKCLQLKPCLWRRVTYYGVVKDLNFYLETIFFATIRSKGGMNITTTVTRLQ